jgi:predicted kinase
MNYKVEILSAFLENKELVQSMKDCDHGHDGRVNPYHLCGSCWCHSMLVYNQADPTNPIELIMALCHDIGKTLVRDVKEDGKVTFYGHADASIQPTIDFIMYLRDNSIINDHDVDYFMEVGLSPMANHMVYYQNYNKLNYFTGNDTLIEMYFRRMARMDGKGSICKGEKIEQSKGTELKEYISESWNSKLPTVTIWTGLPGSGKDYLAEQNNDEILSFDKIRLEVYKNILLDGVWDDLTDIQKYQNAFAYCNANKTDIMKIMSKKAKILLQGGKNANICNTSLTRKARRAIINSIGVNYNYVVKQVFVPTNVIIKRNDNRTNHTVPVKAIHRMMKHMTVCTHFEPHINEIEYILNV